MRLFVAGATGVLGRRAVAGLVAKGHEVVGASRSEANREKLAALGAAAVACDILDEAATTRAAAGCDGVLHLATAIPQKERTRRGDWAANDTLRTAGTRALVAAAKAHGAWFLVESICFFYGDHGDEWVDETTPIAEKPAAILESAVAMERLIADAGVPATILRFGGFYGADSDQIQRLVARVRDGSMRIPGDGAAFMSLIHTDDAAAAVVAAVDRRARGVFCVVDDEPVRQRELFTHLATEVGRKPPGRVPKWLLRLALGAPAPVIAMSQRVRNAKARRELGWAPSLPTYREGYARVLHDLELTP